MTRQTMSRRFFAVVTGGAVLFATFGCALTGTGPDGTLTQAEKAQHIRSIAGLTSYTGARAALIISKESPEVRAALVHALRATEAMIAEDDFDLGSLAQALAAAGITDAVSPGYGELIVRSAIDLLMIIDAAGVVKFDPDITYHARAAVEGIRNGLLVALGPTPEAVNMLYRDAEQSKQAVERRVR